MDESSDQDGSISASFSQMRSSLSTWFSAEIQQMMHGLGDCCKPMATSAALIEETVHRHLQRVIHLAEDVAINRNARAIGIEEFIFLLRKDKGKLKRLLKFLGNQDVRSMSLKTMDEEDAAYEQGGKRKQICRKFLTCIDQTGELLAVLNDDYVDEIKQERLLRAELQTRSMDSQEYNDFCKARQASFTPKYRTQKFREWLLTGVNLRVKINNHGLEIMSYLAFETTAQIVDMALIVRRDMAGQVEDPMKQVLPPVCINHASLAVMQHASPNLTTSVTGFSGAMKSPKSSPSSSPPSTPSDAREEKKRKKGAQSAGKEIYASAAIKPLHIHEAVRRFNLCQGPFDAFSKEALVPLHDKVICL